MIRADTMSLEVLGSPVGTLAASDTQRERFWSMAWPFVIFTPPVVLAVVGDRKFGALGGVVGGVLGLGAVALLTANR